MCWCWRSRREPCTVYVTPAVGEVGGSCHVQLDPRVKNPRLVWAPAGTRRVKMTFNAQCTKAFNMPPGNYTIYLTSDNDAARVISVEVRALQVPSIVGYEVSHASGETARNGVVRAQVSHAPENYKLLWTSGVVTEGPELTNARPGTYAAIILGGAAVHACAPAVVGVGG